VLGERMGQRFPELFRQRHRNPPPALPDDTREIELRRLGYEARLTETRRFTRWVCQLLCSCRRGDFMRGDCASVL